MNLKEKNVLILQGGGALGAYQAGAYSALHEAGYEMDWLSGISIGAINSALIAGNPPEKRTEKLKAFWTKVSAGKFSQPLLPGHIGRLLFNESSAAEVLAFGANGLFKPRIPPVFYNPLGFQDALSYYDTSPLRDTLLELVDFERLNHGEPRISVGAVNVTSGNFLYFDSDIEPIIPEHIMASAALPDGLPPIEIDGEWYWDASLVSNTPLQYVIDHNAKVCEDLLLFQVDLFSAEGSMPKNIMEVGRRMKDIQHSSQTRTITDIVRDTQKIRGLINRLLEHIPTESLTEEEIALLGKWSCDSAITLVHLIYRQKNHELASKDYEFSRLSVEEHWQAGEQDIEHMLSQKSWLDRKRTKEEVTVFDFNEMHDSPLV
ncbi:MAG: patatin-like phospholipase family protein [Gammaproteobacteria bacterium]|jgi:NTE family protein|nr:patatin-like phospholipase family protein [Gammaproteobacteria bacterium]